MHFMTLIDKNVSLLSHKTLCSGTHVSWTGIAFSEAELVFIIGLKLEL